jgi:hypothetical protein
MLKGFNDALNISDKARIDAHKWEVGDHTYGRPNVFDANYCQLKIGKFTSIAREVSIVMANHRTDYVTSYPFVALKKFWPGAEGLPRAHVTNGDVVIGSDVWIGTNACIQSGVTIGHGSVIGAYTMVTKDVPPYAIVVGNQQRIVRYRFEIEIREELLQIAWWDWPDEKVNEYLPFLMSDDIMRFIQEVRRRDSGSKPLSSTSAVSDTGS